MIKLRNARSYTEGLLKIRTKASEIVKLRYNGPQNKLYAAIKKQRDDGRPVRVIILKARQMGFSTLVEALIFWASATKGNVDSLILAHKEDATANLFRMSKTFYNNLPRPLRPALKASNGQELNFDRPTRAPEGTPGLNSRIKCATAGGDGVGRSDTLKNVHMSEFAFWPGNKMETYSGIMQAVPDLADTMVVIESTANGYDEFKDLWDAAVEAWDRGERDGMMPVFFAWWEMEEYRRTPERGFTPTAEERELAETYKLDEEQLAWRRWCIKVNCGGDLNKFHQEYPASPDEAFIATGDCVFDKEMLVCRREQVKDLEQERGRFTYDYDGLKLTNIRWEPDEHGEITIFTKPEPGRPYVVGGDTAGEGSDSFTGQALDNITAVQVARLKHKYDEGVYARQMYCLGIYYNKALLAIETNFSTFPVQELSRLGYPNLYNREVPDTYTGKLKKSYGFQTNAQTRPVLVAEFVEMAREAIETICDRETLGEMLTFVRNDKGRPEAESGKHDDLVMAYGIALQGRKQQRMTVTTKKEQQPEKLIKKLKKAGAKEIRL
ncbi:MAG: hypothetical protein RR949_03810 [Oscillospiraceae bacterium]